MAEMRFSGVVRGYTQGDDGSIHLMIDDSEPSERAKFHVHDLQRSFNPQSPTYGFGAKDVPCAIRPGFAAYRFTVSPEMARNITHGLCVDVVVDVYNVRKVRFYQRRWAAFSEMRHDLISIKPATGDGRAVQGESHTQTKPEGAGKSGK